MKKHNTHRRSASPALFESLEGRQFLSASPAVKADTSFGTTTGLYISNRATTLGQTVTIKAVVTSSGGIPKGGTVELLDDNKDTGLIGTVNHLGYYVFTLDASQALYVGSQEFRIRFLTDGNFVGSISRNLSAKVSAPSLTTESDGLELATVATGSGANATAGETVTVTYTGWNAANGQEFDNSAAHSPGTFSFVLEDNPEQVISGFDQEVLGMKVGQTNVAVIPESLGYPSGSSSSLAGDTLVFVVHLVSIT
jgi:FKBP-type peptidyl-prolyl cis-trans isomerase FkpA